MDAERPDELDQHGIVLESMSQSPWPERMKRHGC